MLNKHKKIITLVLVAALCMAAMFTLGACGKEEEAAPEPVTVHCAVGVL